MTSTSLAGRKIEVDALGEAIRDGGALIVRGPAGIGKSSLLLDAERSARERGMEILRATGVQSETQLPFAGLHQLLRPVLDGVDQLADPQRDALRAAFGGAFTQILLDRGLGAVGVGVSSATVKGILDLPWSTIKSSAPALLKAKGKAVALTPKEFHYAFANTLSEEESNAIHERYAVPGPTTVLHEGAFANFHRNPPTKVDFGREGRAPMLLIGFGEDHVIPAKVSRHQEAKYDDEVTITEYKLFEGRPHFPGAPGWEEVADFALAWAMEHANKTVAEHAAEDTE